MRPLKYKIIITTLIGNFALAFKASAICPVCVVAVGAGLGLSEYLGIDDTIAGVWIGGLLVAVSAWTINWFNKKNWSFGHKDLRDIIVFILYYGLTIWPLFAQNLIGQPDNRLWGIDKLILGIIFGSVGFALAVLWYNNIKKKNNGHAQFPFQKVVWPLGALIILSFVFYFLTK